MPKPARRVPTYRKHKPSGQAVVTLCGTDFYLGPQNSQTSINEYDRLIAEWLANGRRPSDKRGEVKSVVDHHPKRSSHKKIISVCPPRFAGRALLMPIVISVVHSFWRQSAAF